MRQAPLPNTSIDDREVGPAGRQRPGELLLALSLPGLGVVFDLDVGRWPGMPGLAVHPPLRMDPVRYRRDGAHNDADATGIFSEIITGSSHTGTHIDALCHVTSGPRWFGGGNEQEHLDAHGPTWADASSIPPVLCRGVLIDVAGSRQVSALPARTAIGAEEVRAVLEGQGTAIRPGDAVLVRTGYMSVWAKGFQERAASYGAGVDLSAAEFFAESGAVVVGSDTEDFEWMPENSGETFLPVHRFLLANRGIHIVELLFLEDLALERIYEFLFLCLPLRLRGATGSMVRPVAVA